MSPATLVVDTSALIAILKREAGWIELRAAIVGSTVIVPAPVLVEFRVVARLMMVVAPVQIEAFIAEVAASAEIIAFGERHSAAAVDADRRYGKGGGSGVGLNLLDLMVYGVAKVADLPILCTGNDFAKTDIGIHPASRVG